jgi:hypothetical protein
MVINILPAEKIKYGITFSVTKAKFRFISLNEDGTADIGYSLFDDNNEPADTGILKMSNTEYESYNSDENYLYLFGKNKLGITEVS